ncbi:hypothetical protein B0H14DRAFT_1628892 [Mycena olivaceomarginata]|nr:hypothetical protein B0H14DRAFT_1628892 [Mycena olivaceomarginata]
MWVPGLRDSPRMRGNGARRAIRASKTSRSAVRRGEPHPHAPGHSPPSALGARGGSKHRKNRDREGKSKRRGKIGNRMQRNRAQRAKPGSAHTRSARVPGASRSPPDPSRIAALNSHPVATYRGNRIRRQAREGRDEKLSRRPFPFALAFDRTEIQQVRGERGGHEGGAPTPHSRATDQTDPAHPHIPQTQAQKTGGRSIHEHAGERQKSR